MSKPGRKFELGAPHIYNGTSYSWPSENDYPLFLKKKKEIEGFILENVKKYMDEFKMHNMGHYPHLQKHDEHVIVHIATGGEWFTIENSFGLGMVVPHNLDSVISNIVAFNTASDVLDFLDEKTEAPRILIDNGVYSTRYSLPKGFGLLPFEQKPDVYARENLQRIFDMVKLGEITGITASENFQEIRNAKGIIHVENGICEGCGFERPYISRTTFIISTLLWPCNS